MTRFRRTPFAFIPIFLFINCSAPALRTNDDGSILERKIFLLVNEYRASKGLQELAIHEIIARQARNHSKNMALGMVAVGHEGFNERVAEITRRIRYRSAAENVGFNQGYEDPAKTAVKGWLESEEHRLNIEGRFNLTGVGVARSGPNTYYFTQIFLLSR